MDFPVDISVPAGMSEPDEAERAHCRSLVELIVKEIGAAGGVIGFDRFMDLVLYAPGYGYYCGGKRKFGAAGDFVTAPEISPLYSYCLASQCRQVLENMRGGRILEFGPGSGVMAAEILRYLARQNCLPDEYLLLDLSADLRQVQRETLQRLVPEHMQRIRWLDSLPEPGFDGVMIANEVLDAMPVSRIDFSARPTREFGVAFDTAAAGFRWHSREVTDPRMLLLLDNLRAGRSWPDETGPYVTEVSLAVRDWVAVVADILGTGLLLVIDYGFPRREYYHAERSQGTLMCHYRHRAHDNPLILPGLQDITAHVDFTAVAEEAHDSGLHVAGYTTQAHFLISTGLAQILEQTVAEDMTRQIELNQQIKKLTMPHEMGELFKVMALTKNLSLPLAGFAVHDMRGRL